MISYGYLYIVVFVNDIELLDVKAAADYLRISAYTIYKMVNRKANPIPHIRIGKAIKFTKRQLNDFLLKNTVTGHERDTTTLL